MDFEKLFRDISLQQGARDTFFAIHSRACGQAFAQKLQESYEQYQDGDAAFGAYVQQFAAEESLTPEALTLYIYLRMSEQTREDYEQRGIAESVFLETMQVFPICCRLCYEACGIWGIQQEVFRAWTRRILDCRIYRLGRLEFELKTLDVDFEVDGCFVPRGTTVLSTHIPRYLPLREVDCEESYRRAREFFWKYYGMEQCVFVCCSWLLHPWMKECLPENSAILCFQSKYRLLEVHTDVQTAVNWIFPGCQDKDVSEYPTDTTLQRAAIRQIQKEQPIGWALGARL